MTKRILTLALLLSVSQAWAQAQVINAQPHAKKISAPVPTNAKAPLEAKESAIPKSRDHKETNRYQCYTSARNCSGVAYFKNNNNKGIGCTIWKDNGASGRLNFTLGAGESTAYNVIYNDTYTCVWIEYAPPETNLRRDYIAVG
jgi:hypothetical protein